MNPLRDSLAHSLEAEAYRRPTYEPYRFHWTHVIKFVVGAFLTYGLIVALIVIGTAA